MRIGRCAGALGGLLVLCATIACGSPTESDAVDCGALVGGRWSGDVSGSPFTIRIRMLNPLLECPGRGGVVEGTTELEGIPLLGYGSVTPNSGVGNVDLGLVPFTSWCAVSDTQLGDAVTLTGVVTADSLVGTLEGGWREAAGPDGTCEAASDTILNLVRTRVALIRDR